MTGFHTCALPIYAICFAVNSIENYRNLLTLENNIKKYKPVFKYEYFDDKFLDRTYYTRSMLVKIDDFSCQPCLSLDRKNHIELILEVYDKSDRKTQMQLRKTRPIDKLMAYSKYVKSYNDYQSLKSHVISQAINPLGPNYYLNFDDVESLIKRRAQFNHA